MRSNSPLLSLLNTSDWGEYQPLIDQLHGWAQYPLLLRTLEELDVSALFESKIHGLGHIERTICHGAMCAQAEGLSPEDTQLLLLSCAYHDVGRIDDSLDELHGHRSSLELGRLTGCTGEDLRIMQAAVDAHSRADALLLSTVESYHPADFQRALTIATLLKDADGLDRVRIWDLDPKYLRREASRNRAGFAKELYCRYQALTGGAYVPDFVREWKHLDKLGNPL